MKFLFVVVAVASIIYAALVALLWSRQESFLFFPGTDRFDQCAGTDRAPLKPQSAVIGDQQIHYHLHKHPAPSGVIVVFHGNAGTACDRAFYAEMFRDQPYDVLLAEYPGYAGLEGQPGQTEILSAATELVKFARTTVPQGGSLLLLGESIGSGVATYVASQIPVEGLILISPYTSVRALASTHFSWIPTGLVLRHPFPADEWAKQVSAPVLILHGENDQTIPFEMGQAQAKTFSNLRAFVALPGAGHNDWLMSGGTLAVGALHTFVESFLPRD